MFCSSSCSFTPTLPADQCTLNHIQKNEDQDDVNKIIINKPEVIISNETVVYSIVN